ncbi:unnamed protein product [Linum tenue]|uniref:Uncharacterized protein n=1 Tax=Linum tenue TaxID=586396 RepID=A0AAV0MU97_9ROSI|nr:unnamed protein product [Linum tenue]
MHLQVEDISEEAVQDSIDGLLQIQVKKQRSKLKKIFLECRDAVEARTMKPPGISQKNWDDLIDYWLSDKAKGLSGLKCKYIKGFINSKRFVMSRSHRRKRIMEKNVPIAPPEVVDSEEVQDNVDIAPSTRSILRLRDCRRRSSFVRDIAGVVAHSPSCSGSPSTLPRRCGGGTTTRDGRNKGIGFEICRQLASNGVMVVLTARDESRYFEQGQKNLKELGDHVNCSS